MPIALRLNEQEKEIVIQEKDQEGGSGANFIFDWHTKKVETHPFLKQL